jgi:hypothetical protein
MDSDEKVKSDYPVVGIWFSGLSYLQNNLDGSHSLGRFQRGLNPLS